jgi:enoyl-CoA hydratase
MTNTAPRNVATTATGATVQTQQLDSVLVITINRPEVRNAIDGDTARALAEAFDQLDARTDLAIGVLTGAAGTFSAGMDLKAYAAGDTPVLPGRGFAGLTRARPHTPLIAAVEGWAIGGGTEMALACDLIVAAQDATFGLFEVTHGLVPPEGGIVRLPERIPRNIALELLLTGDSMDAATGHPDRAQRPAGRGGHQTRGERAHRIRRSKRLSSAGPDRRTRSNLRRCAGRCTRLRRETQASVAGTLSANPPEEGRGGQPWSTPRTDSQPGAINT